MRVRRVVASLVLLALTAGTAVGHEGGSSGYATIAVDGDRIRYSLTLWPASLPAPVAAAITRARAGDAASRDWLIAAVRPSATR
jgi:hypothetical protein